MDDLISRQAAIDAINTWDKFGVDERSRVVRWHEGLEPYVHLRDVVAAIGNLPSAQPEQRWIPCSERLPEKYGNYLVTTDDGEVDIGSCDPENKDRQDHFWSGCDADGFFWYGENIVIAWMPLPKSYMRGEQE